ncbi:type II toxin-antitoxin system VapC family toxin [Candidatus Desantisbacteria bacterium]|nr:type II toxin-antitoxin system VapC family toxin [Candidatus Desantisbacteria bacterium]
MIVLDTSVIIKWFIEEENTPLAVEFQDVHIKGKEKIVVPELLFYEVVNVLATKTTLAQTEAKEAIDFLFGLELETHSLGFEEFILSLKFSYQYKVTVYDAAYLALAKMLGCKFVTADKKFFEKVKELKNVECLGKN